MFSFSCCAGFRSLVRSVLLGLLAASSALPTLAGPFSISPVRIYMAPRERATAITVTNEGDEPLVMQADIYDWKQKTNGEDELVLTEDMIVSPPIIKVAPKSRQVVRLAMLRPRSAAEQLTYRLIVREIPEARPASTSVQLQIALAFSMPVFITPNGVKRNIVCGVERAQASGIQAVCENTGNAFAQPRGFVLMAANGDKLASADTGGYILPGVKRGFDLKSTGSKVPSGKATLTVTHDDSVTQTFEVSVSE